MASLASNNIPLIVVGCSHLQSQYGIFETFEKLGYSIERCNQGGKFGEESPLKP